MPTHMAYQIKTINQLLMISLCCVTMRLKIGCFVKLLVVSHT